MKIFFSSFFIALVLHSIVLGFFIRLKKQESAIHPNGKSINTIDLQLGTSNGPSRSGGETSVGNATESKQMSSLSDKSAALSDGDSKGDHDGSAGQELSGSGFEKNIVSFTAPTYPRAAQKRGLEGNVRLKITVDMDGTPIETHILQSSGHEILDRAAREAVASWRFMKQDSNYTVEKNVLFRLSN